MSGPAPGGCVRVGAPPDPAADAIRALAERVARLEEWVAATAHEHHASGDDRRIERLEQELRRLRKEVSQQW